MKIPFLIIILFYLSTSLSSQEYFSINIAVAKSTLASTGEVDTNINPKRGANFVLSGIIYPGDYFETKCPNEMNCGVILIQSPDTLYATPEHLDEAVGRWELNAFTIRDLSDVMENGGTSSVSTQIFTFRNDFVPCPGCSIVTEGKDQFGASENISFKRSISGGTGNFSLIRGEVEQIILKQPENMNETGGYNMIVTFFYEID